MFDRIIVLCSELFLKLCDPEITYDDYKVLITDLQRISDPLKECINLFCEFVRNPPFKDLSTKWYASYLLNDVMKIGSIWIYRSKLETKNATELIFNSLKFNHLFPDSYSFDVWEFLEHLIEKYFELLNSEEQLEILQIMKNLFLDSNCRDYKVLEMLQVTIESSMYSISDVDFDIPQLTEIVKMQEYLTLSDVQKFVKLIILDEKTKTSKEHIFELLDELLLILENHPGDDLRLSAVSILQLIWINIFPSNEETSLEFSPRYVRGMLSELKKYQLGKWRGLISIDEVEEYFYRFLTGLKDKFSMVRAEISFMIMLIPFEVFSLSQKELVLEWYAIRSGDDI
jgi:hypothetical protein